MKHPPPNQPVQPLTKMCPLSHQPAHFKEEPVSLGHAVQLMLMLFQQVNVTLFRNKLQELFQHVFWEVLLLIHRQNRSFDLLIREFQPGEEDIAILSSPAVYDGKLLDFVPGTQSVIDGIFLLRENSKKKSLEKSHGAARTFSTLSTQQRDTQRGPH